MYIIIVGAGKMGSEICLSLSREGHDIALIEKNEDRLNDMLNQADITGIVGNGAFYSCLKQVEINKCDMFISVTDSDETNIISCIIAKKLGAKKVMARVRTPEYAEDIEFARESFGINRIINPEREAAREIYRDLQYPGAFSIEPFLSGRINLVELAVEKHSLLDGMSLPEFRKEFPGLIMCIIQDENGPIIPSGENSLRAGQHFYVIGKNEDLNALYKEMKAPDRISSVLIIGGGRIAKYLLHMHKKTGKSFKLIEREKEIAEDIASSFEKVDVILGDGTNQDLLIEENIHSYDCLIALTGVDEENIILSMFADQMQVPRTITKVNRTSLLPIALNVGLQSIITPAKLGATAIVRYVRKLSNADSSSDLESLTRIDDESAEILQFLVKKDFSENNKTLKDISFKKQVLVALINRGGQIIFPTGNDKILEGDSILVVVKNQNINNLNDLLVK